MIEDLSKWQIRHRDKLGLVDQAGFKFAEPRYRRLFVKTCLCAFGIVVVFFGIIGVIATGNALNFAGGITAAGALAALWGFRMKDEYLSPRRVVIFTRRNEILVSKRDYDEDDPSVLEVLPRPFEDVVNVQYGPALDVFGNHLTRYMGPGIPVAVWDVWIYFNDESRYLAGHGFLNEETARVIAAQLNRAIAEIPVIDAAPRR